MSFVINCDVEDPEIQAAVSRENAFIQTRRQMSANCVKRFRAKRFYFCLTFLCLNSAALRISRFVLNSPSEIFIPALCCCRFEWRKEHLKSN